MILGPPKTTADFYNFLSPLKLQSVKLKSEAVRGPVQIFFISSNMTSLLIVSSMIQF